MTKEYELTRNLRALLEQYEKSLPTNEFDSFKRFIGSEVQKYLNKLSVYPAGAERGRVVHQWVEEEIKKSAHIKTTCHRGCGYCCHLEVEITSDDAAVLGEVVKNGYKIDFDKLKRLANRDVRGQEWQAGVTTENSCVFLNENNECGIYLHRPISCRKHSVSSDPEFCKDVLQQNTKILYLPTVEVILSAVINLPDGSHGSFAKMLSRNLET